MPGTDPLLFLKMLREDGIDHIYLSRGPAARGGSGPGKGTAVDEAILKLRAEVQQCTRCAVLAQHRTQTVFGAGDIRAKLVFVGEAPGADEDKQGIPFVGRAGQLLTKIIVAMGLSREEVFICNVLKCRPPGNRPPAPDEVTNCRPFLTRQLQLIKPKIICALGTHASQALLQTDRPISALRGTFTEYEGIPLMCTYHPAYLLRSPGEKGKVWEDMKKILQRLQEPPE
ncbi:MAG: uracil-DNA glycosylase [Candidatus Omnitrophica bacterium]|nr:uracil-DNA glycosylase [Candidatus Omnitrophota bacterium]